MGADPFPADRRLFLQPAGSFPTSPVAVVAGLANPKALCPGDYRLVWNRSARPGATVFPTPSPGGNPDPTADGLSDKVLDSYKSSVLQVPHSNRGTPQAEVDISWDWPASGSAGPALEVEPGATFSVAFNPYPGAGAYKLEVLDGGSVVQTSLATDSGVLEGTVPSAVGAYAYRLSFAEGDFGVGGFEGRTITYPLVAQSEFTSISTDSFVAIEPGTFVMGQEGITNATQSVTLTRGFYMQKTHVTQAQWQSLMGSNPSYFQGCPTCPVENVNWFEAIEFANALSRRDGLPEVYNADGSLKSSDIYATSGYRLPTEAEWEYAYRAGTASTWYNGDDDQRVGDIGWFETNSGYRTRPVALKLPNAFGLFDMAGNVWQWVQ
ncbi:MAG: formylglycine-generating enzyme family protein, partial [Proteobacteria bacterium]|nr:formylglycine-generating enzyme family protein [Pseudomonadota bacterium]